MQSITRHIITGVLTVIPLFVTVWIVWFVVDMLIWTGRPATLALSGMVRPTSPEVADLILAGWFQSGLALLLVLIFLYVLGRVANAVVGRRFLGMVDRLVDAVPLARTIYGATRTLIRSMGGDGVAAGQRVVLIEFPSRDMRVVGIVTRIFPATEDQPELATVYVPTTPNPTSGFVEIVPTSRLTWLDWSKNDAMAFIVSGGSMSPDTFPINWPEDIRRPIIPSDAQAGSARNPAPQTGQ